MRGESRVDTAALKRERPLEDVVAAYGIALRRGGAGRYWALCPFHQERTPSFCVDARDSDDPHFHCFSCLPAGSLIKTEHGMKPIETIRCGDLVYAGDGLLHRVEKVHEHNFAGELVRIRCSPFKVPLLLTPNHKLPVLRPRSHRRLQLPAGEIRAQNYLIYPAVQRIGEPLAWTVRDRWDTNRGPHPRPLPHSVDTILFAEWLGWYLAEGCARNGRVVQLTLGSHEMHHAVRLQALGRILFGTEPVVAHRGNRIDVRFCHALLARWLKHYCGRSARAKRIPSFVWTWTAAEQWRLLYAFMLGDGSQPAPLARFQGRLLLGNWCVGLASATLIDDLRDLLLANGVVPRTVREYRNKHGRLVWHLEIPPNVKEMWGSPPVGELQLRVRSVEHVWHEGRVYNLTVADDHTYVTFSGTVCNCSEHGDVIDLVMRLEGCSFSEAFDRLSHRQRPQPVGDGVGRELPKSSGRRWDQIAPGSAEARILDVAAGVFEDGLRASPRAQRYLQKRGVSLDLAHAQRVGYATGRSLLPALQRVQARDGSPEAVELAQELGLVVKRPDGGHPRLREFFFDRLIIPEIRRGRPIWFIGRAIDDVVTAGSSAGPGTPGQRPRPKYLSMPGERPILGWERVLGRPTAYLVEGPLDWLAGVSWDLPVFAICGTHVPFERLPNLGGAVAIYGVFDPDRAGQSAAERFAPLMGARWRPITLPNGMDLAELAARGEPGRELFQSLVARARATAWRRGRV